MMVFFCNYKKVFNLVNFLPEKALGYYEKTTTTKSPTLEEKQLQLLFSYFTLLVFLYINNNDDNSKDIKIDNKKYKNINSNVNCMSEPKQFSF